MSHQQSATAANSLPPIDPSKPFQLHEIVLVDAKKFHEEYRWWAGYIEELPQEGPGSQQQYKVRFLWTQEFAHMPASKLKKFQLDFAHELLRHNYSLEDPVMLENILRGIRLGIQEVKGKCDYCGNVGELLLCDGYNCTTVCHEECLPKVYDQSKTEGSSEMWLCNECEEALEKDKEDESIFTSSNYWNIHWALKRNKQALEDMLKDLKNQQMLRNIRIAESSKDPNYVPHPQEPRVTEHLEQKIQEITSSIQHVLTKKRNNFDPEEEDFQRVKQLAKDLRHYQLVGSAALMVDRKETLPNAPKYQNRKRPAPFSREDRPSKRAKHIEPFPDEEEETVGEEEEDEEFDLKKEQERAARAEAGIVEEDEGEDVVTEDGSETDEVDESSTVTTTQQKSSFAPPQFQMQPQATQQQNMLHSVPSFSTSGGNSNLTKSPQPSSSSNWPSNNMQGKMMYNQSYNYNNPPHQQQQQQQPIGVYNAGTNFQQQQQQQQQQQPNSTPYLNSNGWMQQNNNAGTNLYQSPQYQQNYNNSYGSTNQNSTNVNSSPFMFSNGAYQPAQQYQQKDTNHINSDDIW